MVTRSRATDWSRDTTLHPLVEEEIGEVRALPSTVTGPLGFGEGLLIQDPGESARPVAGKGLLIQDSGVRGEGCVAGTDWEC